MEIGDPRAQSLFDTAGGQKRTFYADEKALKELKETFGYGEGFLTACLAYCNNDAQQAANMLLEDALPAELARLDRNMPRPAQADFGHHSPLAGDPRAAWMTSALEPQPEEPAAKESAEAQTGGIGRFGDPRAAWVHAGDDITPPPMPAKRDASQGPRDIEDPRVPRT